MVEKGEGRGVDIHKVVQKGQRVVEGGGEVLQDFNLINKLVCKAKKGLDLNRTLPKKVFAYSGSDKFLQCIHKEA